MQPREPRPHHLSLLAAAAILVVGYLIGLSMQPNAFLENSARASEAELADGGSANAEIIAVSFNDSPHVFYSIKRNDGWQSFVTDNNSRAKRVFEER